MPRCVVASAATCDELLDNCAVSLCSNMPQKVQFEGKINANDSTSSEASLVPFEKVKDVYVDATIVVRMPLRKTTNEGIYSYVAPQEVEDIVPQNPCENESHITKLSVSENKSEICDSTKCEVETINDMSVRETSHKMRELYCNACEDDFNTNPLISTSSIVSQSVQICKDIEQEMFAHHLTPLDQRSEEIADVQNQFVAATNMKLEEVGGKNSKVQSNVQSRKLKGNENDSYLNFQEHMVINYDETFSTVTQNCCADSIHSQVKSSAEILQNKTHCSSMHNSCHTLIDQCDDLHAINFIIFN